MSELIDEVQSRAVKRILVVDDDEEMRDLMSFAFSAKGYLTETAEDAEIGYEKALTFMPDLVVSDVHMPNGGGQALADALRSNSAMQNIPIIFLTADSNFTPTMWTKVWCHEKPFSFEYLSALVNQLLKT